MVPLLLNADDSTNIGVAAGLRCTLANSAYTSHELAFQYTDSGARLIFTNEDGVNVVRDMFEHLSLSKQDGQNRIVVMSNDLRWAGGPDSTMKPEAAGLFRMEELLTRGTMAEEEKFEGKDAHETVYLCYSSVILPSFIKSLKYSFRIYQGTTGKPKVSLERPVPL